MTAGLANVITLPKHIRAVKRQRPLSLLRFILVMTGRPAGRGAS
jgi:hypothetical protein